MNYIAMLYFYY